MDRPAHLHEDDDLHGRQDTGHSRSDAHDTKESYYHRKKDHFYPEDDPSYDREGGAGLDDQELVYDPHGGDSYYSDYHKEKMTEAAKEEPSIHRMLEKEGTVSF